MIHLKCSSSATSAYYLECTVDESMHADPASTTQKEAPHSMKGMIHSGEWHIAYTASVRLILVLVDSDRM
jgi:hypothetical protein